VRCDRDDRLPSCQDLQAPLSWAGDGEFDVAVMPLVIHHALILPRRLAVASDVVSERHMLTRTM
jgi:hypothetical protein